MTHGDIEDRNLTELADFLEKMIGCGILVPDDQLEDFVRLEGNLPERLDVGERADPILDEDEKREFHLDQAAAGTKRQANKEEPQKKHETDEQKRLAES